ncbi:AAA family ATPase [Alcaligenaceae bacterium]|nr:AAA family ATPase [Alcaligenaceae bacterium]
MLKIFNQDSLLSSFQLRGLYGYKDIGIECGEPVSIILAENGVGKTTLMNALYALLSGRISRLTNVDFSEAILKFGENEIIFSKEQAFKKKNLDAKTLLQKRGIRELLEYGINTEQILDLLLVFIEGGAVKASRHPAFRILYRSSPYDEDDILIRLERLRSMVYDSSYIAEFRKKVIDAMGGVQVLYLPTYRRIEADFQDVSLSRNAPRRRPPAGDAADSESERDELIFFGLSDVEEKLARMTQFIQRSMFESYSKLSGNVIDTLLGVPQSEYPNNSPFDMEAVRLMLGRLGKSNTATEDRLERAIGGASPSDERYKPLVYFLRQLLESYEASRPQELALEEFAKVVNGYLQSGGSEEKYLVFDKLKLTVEIWNSELERALPFGSLSSGEKQIISIFSRLLLEGKKRHLILIDEPELSLSIEWQRRFLPDILKANSCAQLIAITHSPFVFENELDSFARSIRVSARRRSNGQD